VEFAHTHSRNACSNPVSYSIQTEEASCSQTLSIYVLATNT